MVNYFLTLGDELRQAKDDFGSIVQCTLTLSSADYSLKSAILRLKETDVAYARNSLRRAFGQLNEARETAAKIREVEATFAQLDEQQQARLLRITSANS